MFISKETLTAYFVVHLLSASTLVSAVCQHADGIRLMLNNNCHVGGCTAAGTCWYMPCFDVSIHHIDGSWTVASDMVYFDMGKKGNFRIKDTEWELFLDGHGGFDVMSLYNGCNMGGMGCEARAVRLTRRSLPGVSKWYYDCQNTGPVPK